MRTTKQLLSFDEQFYLSSIEGIKKVASLLVKAAEEIENLEAGTYQPQSLKHGKFLETAIDFHKKEWKENIAFKRVSFDKYVEFIEMDFSRLEQIEKEYNNQITRTFEFYKFNHLYYAWCEHRYADGLADAGDKVSLNLRDMFKFEGDTISVTLSEEYYKLYCSNDRQIEKVKEINTFFEAAKNLDVPYETTKHALRYWTKEIAYDLSGMEIDFYYLLKTVN